MKINIDNVLKLKDVRPKRICFETTHKDVLKIKSDGTMTIRFPFQETIKRLIEKDVGIVLNDDNFSDSACYCYLDERQYKAVHSWIEKHKEKVFLRDCLDLSIALSINKVDPSTDKRTVIGEHEYQAKQKNDKTSIGILGNLALEAINDLPFYKDCRFITAVPSSNSTSLPCQIVSQICIKQNSLSDLTGNFSFANKKRNVKDASLEDKWKIWKDTGIQYNGRIENQDIILLDDKYQSGVTIQYIAMILKNAGAKEVFGLSVVKTMRDTDNAKHD